ncbi:MAG: hypothetical protein HQ579_09535 [Candidatus Omnitrophica bacterium]|nr:hypothetical protein [Candidatus Omnitrophota bacterium]
MKKAISKIIAIVTVLCFLASNVSFALDARQITASSGGINLATPVVLDDIAEGTPHDKKMALGTMKLQMYLQLMDDRYGDLEALPYYVLERLTEGFKQEAKKRDAIGDAIPLTQFWQIHEKEDTIYDPASITLFHNEIKHLGGHIFSIPVCVNKRSARHDYTLIFSTVKNSENIYPIFPCMTIEEFRARKDDIMARAKLDLLPKRKTTANERARERYIEHERIIDPFWAQKLKDKSGHIKCSRELVSALLNMSNSYQRYRYEKTKQRGKGELRLAPFSLEQKLNSLGAIDGAPHRRIYTEQRFLFS